MPSRKVRDGPSSDAKPPRTPGALWRLLAGQGSRVSGRVMIDGDVSEVFRGRSEQSELLRILGGIRLLDLLDLLEQFRDLFHVVNDVLPQRRLVQGSSRMIHRVV